MAGSAPRTMTRAQVAHLWDGAPAPAGAASLAAEPMIKVSHDLTESQYAGLDLVRSRFKIGGRAAAMRLGHDVLITLALGGAILAHPRRAGVFGGECAACGEVRAVQTWAAVGACPACRKAP